MKRRDFLKTSSLLPVGAAAASLGLSPPVDAEPLPAPPPLAFQGAQSGLKITGVRMVNVRPRKPIPTYTPSPGSWSTGGVEVANPMSIYPKYKAQRSLFMADDLGPSVVEITTDKGITGLGEGGPGSEYVVEKHLKKLLVGENPFDIERLWDIMWRSTMYYGRKGLVVHAISGVDNALWDLIGNCLIYTSPSPRD